MTASRQLELGGTTLQVPGVPGRGAPIVLLHGAAGNGPTWTPVLDALRGHDVWCPSLPGRPPTGGSPLPDVDAAAAWLGRVVSQIGDGPVVVVGHSFGGAVALELAATLPHLVRALVLVSSGARLRVAPALLEAVTAGEPFDWSVAFGPQTPDRIVRGYEALASTTPKATAAVDWHACDAFDRLGHLDDIRHPVDVVYGEHDVMTPPKRQRSLVEALPDATATVVPNVGHMLPWEAPVALAEVLAKYAGV